MLHYEKIRSGLRREDNKVVGQREVTRTRTLHIDSYNIQPDTSQNTTKTPATLKNKRIENNYT